MRWENMDELSDQADGGGKSFVSQADSSAILAMNGFAEPLVHHHDDNGDNNSDNHPLLPFHQLCADLSRRITHFLHAQDVPERVKDVQRQTRCSLRVIDQALEQYSLPELSLAYNGGKDCLVLLILYLYALHKNQPGASSPHGPVAIQSVYIQDTHPFPEVDAFVTSSVAVYSLSLRKYAKPMKAAFSDYLHDLPSVKAVFVGTRRTDPHGQHLTHFDPTDSGWPAFVRIHPVIDWHYADIWTFIRYLNVPYCSLYDLGYTSLGGTTNTQPNPALARRTSTCSTPPTTPPPLPQDEASGAASGAQPTRFRPAYELLDDHEERLGRGN